MKTAPIILVSALAIAIMTAGCQPTVHYNNASSAMYVRQSESGGQLLKQRVISTSVAIDLAVENDDTATVRIKSAAVAAGGYIVNTMPHGVVFRVPAIETDRFIAYLATIGEIKSKNMSGQDITEEYYDIQTRLDNAESARKRYLELLAKAENVEAALKVERELERLNGDIETMKGKIARMKELSTMTTISVNYASKTSPGPLGYIFVYLAKGIRWLFVWD